LKKPFLWNITCGIKRKLDVKEYFHRKKKRLKQVADSVFGAPWTPCAGFWKNYPKIFKFDDDTGPAKCHKPR
jgi:hypothetical protein